MTNRDGSRTQSRTMTYTHFTDAENTGVPLVPMIESSTDVAADGGETVEQLEEVVWSHRLQH